MDAYRMAIMEKAGGLIAGKPAPTGNALILELVQYLWELACRRLGHLPVP